MVRMRTITVVLVGAMLVAMLLPAAANAGTPKTSSAQRQAAATAAVAKVGSPYHPGSTGPRRFDCSGLVAHAYRTAGAPLAGRSSYDLWKLGAKVRRGALQRGDLVWTWDRSLGHVGVYLGDGTYVHAPGRGRRVEIAKLPTGTSFIGAVRP